MDILRTQLNHLKDDELLQRKIRRRLVVVITDKHISSLMSEALKIYEMMWVEYKVVAVVVLMSDF